MSMERIIGIVFSGFAVKLYAAIFAVVVAYHVGGFFIEAMHQVSHGLTLPK